MNIMLPWLLMDQAKSNSSSANRDLMMLMAMGGSGMDSASILPLMMMEDNSLDFKNFFLYSNLLRQDCRTETGAEFSALLPLLLMQEGLLIRLYAVYNL